MLLNLFRREEKLQSGIGDVRRVGGGDDVAMFDFFLCLQASYRKKRRTAVWCRVFASRPPHIMVVRASLI